MNDQGLVNVERALTFEKLARHLPDSVCNAFEPFLPPVVWCGNGRPPISNRDCLHAAIFILISGTPWKLMPACFPSYKTVRKRLRRWVEQEAFRQLWSASACRYGLVRGINFDQLSIDGARKPSKKGGAATGPNPTDRAKSGTQVVVVASAEDLPLGAAICSASQQDATFTQRALASVVVPLPLDEASQPLGQLPVQGRARLSRAERRRYRRGLFRRRNRDGRLSEAVRRALQIELDQGQDLRALPYLRGDGNFAKVPARCDAKRAGFRLWAPDRSKRQSRRGLGVVRSAVERVHALLNQFGRVFRRLDRDDNLYLAWVQLACCIIFLRRGFFP